MFSLNSKIGKTVLFIITVYFVYTLLFIWNTSYSVNGQRYFSLLDDAMISMRYADNYAAGEGPYFNSGSSEKVEGFTNPLWMVIMTGVHLLPVAKQYTSLFIQLLAALLMSINLYFTAKLADALSNSNKYAIILSIVLTGFYLPLNVWSLGGMEVAAIVPIVTATMYYLFLSVREQKIRKIILLLPAIGTLLRPDFLLIFITVYFIATTYINTKNKSFERLFMILLFAVIFLLLSFNLYYYDDILPNTYYLKMTGYPVFLRITRGLSSIISMLPLLFLAIIIILLKNGRQLIKNNSFLVIVPLVLLLYNIYIGGDAWDWWNGANRFISPIVPILFVFTVTAFFSSFPNAQEKFLKNKYVNAVIFVLVILFLNMFGSFESLQEFALLKAPVLMKENRDNTIIAMEADKILLKDAHVAVATAGVIPYYLDRYIIDILGKNDKTIAKINGRVGKGFAKYHSFIPGHNKWDYSYSIGYLEPDAVLQLWEHHEEALPYLSKKYKLVNAGHFYFFIKLNKNY